MSWAIELIDHINVLKCGNLFKNFTFKFVFELTETMSLIRNMYSYIFNWKTNWNPYDTLMTVSKVLQVIM